jgi:mercuric ion transport protein
MRLAALTAGLVAWIGAALASLCCLLPLAVIVLGLGSGAFMATTMQYRWLLVPAGSVGIITGFALYVRERRRCDALACRMAGSRITFVLLIVASLVVATAIVLDRFPEFTSDLLAHAMSGDAPHPGHDMGGMR